MATDIVLRSIKAAALTHAEMDQNWESLAQTIDSQTSSYTVLVADQNKIIEANISSGTITLPTVTTAAATDTDSFKITVKNIHATSLILTGNGSETIDSAASITLLTNECVTLSLSANAAEWTIIYFHGPNLTGITATSTESNYSVGVTSAIQTQLNNKQTLNSGLSDIASLAKTDSNFIVGNGSNWIAETGATARTSLGLGTADNVTHNDLTVNDIGANNVIANDVTVNGAFSSIGIDDNATSNAITIDASENVAVAGKISSLIATGLNDLQLRSTDSANGVRMLYGNNISSAAATIAMYGSTHAVRAQEFWIANESSNPLILGVSGVEAIRIDSSGNTHRGDTKHSYWGAGDYLDIIHNGITAIMLNNTGNWDIQSLSNSSNINIITNDLGGTARNGIVVGGSTPNVKLYYNGVLALTTMSGGISLKAGEIQIYNNGSSNVMAYGGAGHTQFDNTVNTGEFQFNNDDAGGTVRRTLTLGGASPNVRMSYNGTLEGSTLSGSLDGTNDLTIGGSTKIVKETKIDWPNFNGVAQISVEKGGTVNTTASTLTDYMPVFVPLNATTLRYAAEMSCSTDNSRITYMLLQSVTQTGTECSQIGNTARTFPTNSTQEGTLDVSDQQGNFIMVTSVQRNNAAGGGTHSGTVYNIVMYFE